MYVILEIGINWFVWKVRRWNKKEIRMRFGVWMEVKGKNLVVVLVGWY